MASTNQTDNMSVKTVWYLTPDSDKIQKITLPEDFNDYAVVRPFLHCEWVEYQGFTNKLGKEYGVLMDEEGLFKSVQRKNDCARRLFRKIPLRWGTFTNYFIVYAFECFDEGNIKLRDMDITPKEFVEQFTEAITHGSSGLF